MANKYATLDPKKFYLVDNTRKRPAIYDHPLKDERLSTIQKDFSLSRLPLQDMKAVSGQELNTNPFYANYDVLRIR